MNRKATCGGGDNGGVWQAAYAEVASASPEGRPGPGHCGVFISCSAPQAQKTADPTWRLLFLQSDGEVSSMSVGDAQKQGYSLATSAQRVVLRSRYQQQQAEVLEVSRPASL